MSPMSDIPECYDPIFQEERRQSEWDHFVEDLPVCSCCRRSVYPGDHYHETRTIIVCASCMEDLMENECILEV